jgi:hypothetical protein
MTADDISLPDEKLLAAARALETDGIPHAIGGAVALVYWGEPRGTVDVDINIFLPEVDAPRVFKVLSSLGLSISADDAASEVLRTGQIRLDWEGTFIDLFFAYDPFHDSCNERAVTVDFNGAPIRVLSGEDLVVFKIIFNRPKDWIDIEQLIAVQASHFDVGYVMHWTSRILGDDDARLQRLADLVKRYGDADE